MALGENPEADRTVAVLPAFFNASVFAMVYEVEVGELISLMPMEFLKSGKIIITIQIKRINRKRVKRMNTKNKIEFNDYTLYIINKNENTFLYTNKVQKT